MTVLSQLDGAFQVGTPALYISDVVVLGALLYLTARRFRNPEVRYVSLPIDYLALFLLLGIVISGLLIRFVARADVVAIKQFALALAVFHPVVTNDITTMFLVHLLPVSYTHLDVYKRQSREACCGTASRHSACHVKFSTRRSVAFSISESS